jgi:hypothetical protein
MLHHCTTYWTLRVIRQGTVMLSQTSTNAQEPEYVLYMYYLARELKPAHSYIFREGRTIISGDSAIFDRN